MKRKIATIILAILLVASVGINVYLFFMIKTQMENNKNMSTTVDELTNQLSDMQETIKAQKNEIATLEENCESYMIEANDYANEVEILNTEIEELKKEIEKEQQNTSTPPAPTPAPTPGGNTGTTTTPPERGTKEQLGNSIELPWGNPDWGGNNPTEGGLITT